MKTLTIEQPALFGLTHRRRSVSIPESYDELSSRQFQAIVLYAKRWITETAFFARFFDIPLTLMGDIDPFIAYRLNQQLNFLKELTPVDRMLIPDLNARAEKRTRRLLPPGPKLSGMTFQQFMTVDTFHAWYLYTEREEHLYNFITSLYTDPDIPFSQVNPEANQKAILADGSNTRELMECVVVNWMLIKKWLANAYPSLFPPQQPDGTNRQETPQGKKKRARPSSWLVIFDALVDEDFTRINTYQTLPAIDVIRIINRKISKK